MIYMVVFTSELQNDYSYEDHDSFPTKELNNTNIQKVKELMKGGLRIGFFQAIWTAVLILVCQCISVKFPKYVDQVWNLHYICLVLIMLLIISCLAELPLAVHDYKVSYDSNSEKNWRDIYEYIYALGFSSSIPLIILIVSVTILYRDLKTLKKNSVKCKCERVPSIQKMLENTKEITLILFIIVVIFVVSTSFYLIYVIVFDRILRFVTDERIISQCVKPICKDISHLLLGLNAGSSIVIFAWKRQKFRRQLFNFIQRRKFSTISEIGSPNKETKI